MTTTILDDCARFNLARRHVDIKIRVCGVAPSRRGWITNDCIAYGYDLGDAVRSARRESQGWKNLEFKIIE